MKTKIKSSRNERLELNYSVRSEKVGDRTLSENNLDYDLVDVIEKLKLIAESTSFTLKNLKIAGSQPPLEIFTLGMNRRFNDAVSNLIVL